MFLEQITHRKINDFLAEHEGLINGGLFDRHFSVMAQIAASKIAGTCKTQLEVSVTHKLASTRFASITRFDQFGNVRLPRSIGRTSDGGFIRTLYSPGGVLFSLQGDEYAAIVDINGWSSGSAPVGPQHFQNGSLSDFVSSGPHDFHTYTILPTEDFDDIDVGDTIQVDVNGLGYAEFYVSGKDDDQTIAIRTAAGFGDHTGESAVSYTYGAGTITKAGIKYDPDNSWFEVSLDGVVYGWVDCLNVAGVFVNSEPGGTRTASTGKASIDFSSGTRIDFINNGVIVGYIDSTGTHEGTP